MARIQGQSALSRLPVRLAIALLLAAFCLPGAQAAIFEITDTLDAIPAPPGTLRWAIENSELNNQPDRIVFLIDGGTIELVAPLPDLLEGGLSMVHRTPVGEPPQSNGLIISGVGTVDRAIAVRSADNVISGFDFVSFDGNETLLIAGPDAVGNRIVGNVFRGSSAGTGGGAAIRIAASPFGAGTPGNIQLTGNRFDKASTGIVVAGDGIDSPAVGNLEWPGTIIQNNAFGPDLSASADPAQLLLGIQVSDARVFINDNTFSGLERGIDLGTGAHDALVTQNRIGRTSSDGLCDDLELSGIRVRGSDDVTIRDNTINCTEIGIELLSGADDTFVGDNLLGGIDPAAGNRSHGVLLDGARRATLRRNTVVGNVGTGVISLSDGSALPPQHVLSCNAIYRNGGGAISLANTSAPTPQLTSAGPLAVEGDTLQSDPAWVEVFGDSASQSRLFQGAVQLGSDGDTGFNHRLPVLDLRVEQSGGGSQISFDTEIPANHTATTTLRSPSETSELSAPLAASAAPVLYDVIRGDLGSLGFGINGINLGEVTCIDSAIAPGAAVVDGSDDPEPGEAFFYLARRRSNDLANGRGTYDPAICLTDLDDFSGPRRTAGGDCN
ncbi:hypothetical protein ABI59_12405 [Acidobacteria bacterium Mor1]|nr:hypothetical protein ABI59_12405 [Acidobacteria bacterium Mor1]